MKKWLLFCSVIFNFFNVLPSFEHDLDFIYHCLKENYPGYYDNQNPQFSALLEEMYKNTKEKLQQTVCDEEKRIIIKETLKQFNCGHLRVSYDNDNPSWHQKKDSEKLLWRFETIKDHVYFIKIPTFEASIFDVASKNNVLEKIVAHKHENNICFIFDLRGNSGGNSYFGQEILSMLFGETVVKQANVLLNQNVFVEWRASKDNISFIENFYNTQKENGLLDKTLKEYFEKLLKDLKETKEKGEIFYVAKNNQEEIISCENFKRQNTYKIIALIDKGCASATLNFLDWLLTIDPSVLLIGQETAGDSVYMDICRIELPSKKGRLVYPMKVFRGRKRGNNETYKPDIIF